MYLVFVLYGIAWRLFFSSTPNLGKPYLSSASWFRLRACREGWRSWWPSSSFSSTSSTASPATSQRSLSVIFALINLLPAPKADGLTAIEMFMIVNIIFVFCALIGIKTAWIQCQCVIVKILSEYAVILFSQKIKTSQRPKIRKAAMRSSTEVCKWWRFKILSSDLKAKPPPRFKVRLWGWTWTATALWPRGRCWRPKNSHQRRWTMIISILGNNYNICNGQKLQYLFWAFSNDNWYLVILMWETTLRY